MSAPTRLLRNQLRSQRFMRPFVQLFCCHLLASAPSAPALALVGQLNFLLELQDDFTRQDMPAAIEVAHEELRWPKPGGRTGANQERWGRRRGEGGGAARVQHACWRSRRYVFSVCRVLCSISNTIHPYMFHLCVSDTLFIFNYTPSSSSPTDNFCPAGLVSHLPSASYRRSISNGPSILLFLSSPMLITSRIVLTLYSFTMSSPIPYLLSHGSWPPSSPFPRTEPQMPKLVFLPQLCPKLYRDLLMKVSSIAALVFSV